MKNLLHEAVQKKTQEHPMLLSTIDIPDLVVRDYIGIVTGVGIISSGFIKDFYAKIKDLTGGTPEGYLEDFKQTIYNALNDMVDHAATRNADAVIGITLDSSTISTERGGFFFIVATGTAVAGERKLQEAQQGNHHEQDK